jgi:hypothetical protein
MAEKSGERLDRVDDQSQPEQQVSPAQTCGHYDVLDLCELAHRDVIGQNLCLSDPTWNAEAIRAHLNSCDCCRRWYRNARRAYRARVPAVKEKPLRLKDIATRHFRKLRPLPAASDRLSPVQHEALPPNDATDLTKLRLVVSWEPDRSEPDEAAEGSRWWVTLRFPGTGGDANPHEANPHEALEVFDSRQLAVEVRHPSDPEGGLRFVTRLDFDEKRIDLVSIRRRLVISNPEKAEAIGMELRKGGRGGSSAGD